MFETDRWSNVRPAVVRTRLVLLTLIALLVLAVPSTAALAAAPPTFDVPPTPLFGATLIVDAGQLLEFPVQASDADVQAAVTQIAVGLDHTCALLDSGAVRCWGYALNGRLGYGNEFSIGENETPASAGDVDVGGTVVQIAAGGYHTCALLVGGAVRCWGWGINGQLGYGNEFSIGDDETPASAGNVDVGGTVAQIAAGTDHTCALLVGGTVRCWGRGHVGALGYGNTDDIGDDETPASAGNVDVGGTVTQIALGGGHSCALLNTGAVRCWGFGSGGRLGYGNTNNIGDNELPASAGDVNVGGTVAQIALGGRHTCALLDTSAVRCWGRGNDGQLGYSSTNNIGDNEFPASAGNVDVGGTVTQIALGGVHTCALLDTGAVRCWGESFSGRLGYANNNKIGDNETPASAGDVIVGGTVAQVVAGSSHTCALLDSDAVRCWGRGDVGALGYGNPNNIGDNETPASAGDVEVVDLGDTVALGVVGLPAGAGFAPGAPANPATVTFTWIPTAADVGVHAVTFTAEDSTGLFATPHTIDIEVAPAFEEAAIAAVEELGTTLDGLDLTDFGGSTPKSKNKARNNERWFSNQLDAVLGNIEADLFADALDSARNILGKVDGCAERDGPDPEDKIVTCGGQAIVDPLVRDLIAFLEELVP